MNSALSFSSVAALFASMLLLAFVPGVSVLAVCARAGAGGFVHGVFTTIGIVSGDVVFIVIAMFGLTALSAWSGPGLALVRYIGGAWLIWLGVSLWLSDPRTDCRYRYASATRFSSFLSGLVVTLGDQKAVLFYLGFLPAFVDLSKLSPADAAVVILVAIFAVGIPKLVYAYLAHKGGSLPAGQRTRRALNRLAGSLMAGIGLFLIAVKQ